MSGGPTLIRAVDLLEEVGLISARDRVTGLVTSEDLSRSNSNVKVVAPSASYFLKLGRSADARGSQTPGPGHEIRALRALRELRPNALPWIPRIVHALESEEILVLPMLPMRSLRVEEIDDNLPADETIYRVGAALACLHGTTDQNASGLRVGSSRCAYHLEPKWKDVLANARCYRRTLAIIAGSAAIAAGLREVDRVWTACTPIHGDLRWDNLLVEVDENEPIPSFTFIDFETAVVGDPRWDVACFLADSMSSWIRRGARFAGWDRSVKRREVGAIRPKYQKVARHFLHGYESHEATGMKDREVLVKMVAARLIQSAVEASVHTREMTQPIVDHLQIAENMFKAPLDLGTEVLGLRS